MEMRHGEDPLQRLAAPEAGSAVSRNPSAISPFRDCFSCKGCLAGDPDPCQGGPQTANDGYGGKKEWTSWLNLKQF